MKRRLYKTYIRTTKLNQKLSEFVTPAGTVVIIIFVIALLFGNSPEKNYIYQITLLSLSLLSVSLLFSLRFSTAVRVIPIFPKKCSVGEKAFYHIDVENRGTTQEDGLFYREHISSKPLSLELFLNGREEGEEKRNKFDRVFGYYRWKFLTKIQGGVVPQFTTVPRLLPREKRRMTLSFMPLRRGYIHFNGFSLFRSDPFGLFRRKISVDFPTNVIVYPAVFPLEIEYDSGAGLIRTGAGNETNQKGCSGDFLSLREYVPGDPVKQIDWKSTAKGSAVIIKELQKESQSRSTVFLDIVSALSIDPLVEDAISYVSSLIVSATVTANIEDVVTVSALFRARFGSNEAKKERLLEALATVESVPESDSSYLFNYITSEHRTIGNAIVILTSLSPINLSLLRELSLVRIPFSAILIVKESTPEIEKIAEKKGVRVIEKDSWHRGRI